MEDTENIVAQDEKFEVLAEDEKEYTTDSVIRIEDDFFFRRANGGSRGAYQANGSQVNTFYTYIISRAEARAKMLEMGLDVPEVYIRTLCRKTSG